MVSKASEDFPEPESPVITTSRSRGISRSMFLRLCSRAPLMTIFSATGDARDLSVPALSSRARCVLDRGDHAGRIGPAGPRDVVGGAVIGRGAHERQSQRDVHGPIKLQSLERYQPLIVGHRDRRVEAEAAAPPDERGG